MYAWSLICSASGPNIGPFDDVTREHPLSSCQFAGRPDPHKERRTIMFARIVEFIPKPEKKEELVKVIRTEVLPILKKQTGFLEVLPFVPEAKTEEIITVTLWMEERNAKRYEREVYPRVEETRRPI
jgi:quinol monooxygenase YgiN